MENVAPPRGTVYSANTGKSARARVIKRPIVRTVKKESTEEVVANTKKAALKGGYILFFLVLGIAIIKDFLDLFFTLLDFGGTALAASVILAPVGLGLTLISELASKLFSFLSELVFLTYFWYIGGRFAFRLAVMSIGAIIELIPFVNLLPLTTLTFVIAFISGRVIQKVTSSAMGRVVSLGKKVLS